MDNRVMAVPVLVMAVINTVTAALELKAGAQTESWKRAD